MTRDDLLTAAGSLLAQSAGLRATPATEARLESCLHQRADARGIAVDDYVERLVIDPVEVQTLIDGLTVQETSFFRDAAHLDALTRVILPRHHGPVVLWSAGCATGQEPYSLAMALDEAGIDDWRIVATDLSRPAVERTIAGRYRESELRGLSPARRGRYLTRDGAMWVIDPELRERVTVHHHNLLTDPIPVGDREATAVFCRNVLIYLRRDRAAAFLVDVRDHLVPGGVLFLGGSEALWRVRRGYAHERIGDAFGYRRVEPQPRDVARRSAAAAPVASPVPVRPLTPTRPLVVPEPAVVAPPVVAAGAESEPDERSAVTRYRQAVYLAPDDPLAHLHLGLSLEAEGDDNAGRRAFRAALAALGRADRSVVETQLEGYGVDTLEAVLTAKLAGEEPCP